MRWGTNCRNVHDGWSLFCEQSCAQIDAEFKCYVSVPEGERAVFFLRFDGVDVAGRRGDGGVVGDCDVWSFHGFFFLCGISHGVVEGVGWMGLSKVSF